MKEHSEPSKEERKRLLIEMMKEDEKNGMYEDPLDKFMDEEIAYLKSCNPVDKWGRLDNQFAAGMIHAYERIKGERESEKEESQEELINELIGHTFGADLPGRQAIKEQFTITRRKP